MRDRTHRSHHSFRKGGSGVNEFENLDPQSSESGFGMIEIIVSMFLLALLAVAFLPLLINTLQLGPKNAAIAAGKSVGG